MKSFKRELIGALNTLVYLFQEAWNAIESCGPCCGIRLERKPCPQQMPTAGSCCGVRV